MPPARSRRLHSPTDRTHRPAFGRAGRRRFKKPTLQREKDSLRHAFFQGRSGRNRGACGAIDLRCAVVSGICTESSRSPGLRRPTTYPPTLCVARQTGGYRLPPRVVSPRRPVRFQSLPKSSFRVRTPLRESAHPCARDTPSPKAAGPHRPDRGLRGWPSGVLSPRHQRANVGRRGTWPLPGAAPAMVLSFSQRWRQ